MNRAPSQTPLRILFASSEALPLIGSGDLATFSTTLTTTLTTLGQDVRMVLPAYPQLLANVTDLTQLSRICVTGSTSDGRLFKGKLGHGTTLYLVDIPGQFDRQGDPYRDENGTPWSDNGVRFGLFSRVVARMAINQARLNWQPDLLHCNGWQTGLAIPLLSGEWSRPATVYTLHEAEHRFFSGEQIRQLAMPIELLKSGILAMDGQFSFEKGALLTSDWLSLPSLGYRTELLSDQTDHPLGDLFRVRRDRLTGITSGIDYQRWGPTTNPHITQPFDSSSFELKQINRRQLQIDLNLQQEERSLLIGYIGSNVSLTETNLIAGLIKELGRFSPLHILASVSGESTALQPLIDCARRLPQLFTLKLGENEPLRDQILASSDCLLLPSPHYPSAYQAQRALSYGTVPIAHGTEAIQAVLKDATPTNLLHGVASSFVYTKNTLEQLINTLERVHTFHAKPAIWWQKLALNGMNQSFHATESARGYLDLYHSAIDNPTTNPVGY